MSSNCPSNDELAAREERLKYATTIARQAGEQTMKLFRTTNLKVVRKGDGSPVTQADQQAEELLRSLISERFPQDAILGEEFGETPGTSGFTWVLDPIDGTKSFVSGVPLYTTLVAVMSAEQPVVGVIYAPAVDEMVYASQGGQCWHLINGHAPQQARVSEVASLEEAVFVTTSVKSFTTERNQDDRPVFDQLQKRCRVTRTWGDAFGYLLVATGRAEVMIDPAMNLWDAAALQPIIEAAGGTFTDWQGRRTVHSGESLATNSNLAEEVLGITKTG